MRAHGDFETGSACDLLSAGAAAYAEHPTTRVWMLRYRIGDSGPVQEWRPGWPDPVDLLNHIAAGGIFVAHNAMFERSIWNRCLRARVVPHWPEMRIEQMDCTMARCAHLGIPSSLEIAAQVLRLPFQKDMEGAKAMARAMKPRKVHADGTLEWWADSDPHLVDRVSAYCATDVLTESALDDVVPPLSERERAVWILDQRINERGVRFDLGTVRRAISVREEIKHQLDLEMSILTNRAVSKCSQVARLVQWVNEQGLQCDGLPADEHADLIDLATTMDMPQVVRAIELRQQASKTSTAKLDAMVECVCNDGRARGLLAYSGTNTHRWAGRLVQPQNLKRIDPDRDSADVALAIEYITKLSTHDCIEAMRQSFSDPPMVMLAKCMRAMIVAGPGKTLRIADLSNIEGRLAAWFAGEEWKLEAFRLYDAGLGPDLYKIAYSRSFATAIDTINKAQRQIGKVQELALGYQGAVGSFLNMASVYGMKIADLVPAVKAAVTPDDWFAQMDRYRGARDKHGLPQEQWAAVKIVIMGWRDAHPKLVQGWWDLQDAAVEAVANPGTITYVFDGKARYLRQGTWLYLCLPSGGIINYCNPELEIRTERWVNITDKQRVYEEDVSVAEWAQLVQRYEMKLRTRKVVTYEGYDGERKRWSRFALYGGMQFNHLVQGTAREVLVEGMFAAEAAGHELILTVHDENVSEGNDLPPLKDLMAIVPPWLQGCPLAAAGAEGERYTK